MELRLRELLKEKHISIRKLSEISGISQSNISNYILGKVSPTLDTLNKIAISLNVPITDLFVRDSKISLFVKYDDNLTEITKQDIINLINNKNHHD